jgi:hypothetical protein
MSKNLTIDEGGESRHFDGVKRLKTKLAGENAGTCYWVPEDETQAWPTFIMDNGMHSAEDEGVYGFTEAMVNVYIPSPNPDWDIWIDDIDIPHIHIDDIDIHIDDIDIHIDDIELTIDNIEGTPIVDIEGVDIDGIEIPDIDIHMDNEGLPISDIDFKTDIHVWTDPDDHTKIHVKEEPNGEEIVLDYDDIDGTATFKGLLDIRYDDSTGKWIIEAHTKIKVDDVDYEAGDEIKSWSKDETVDFTMKVEQEISVDFPDLDPDFMDDFDIELDLDNIELDMDGLDMDIDLPMLKMPDLDDELPDEIRIMHVPDKTSYKDGEAIDLDGIVVQAYKNGSVWQNKKYINGYIPAHELEMNSGKTSGVASVVIDGSPVEVEYGDEVGFHYKEYGKNKTYTFVVNEESLITKSLIIHNVVPGMDDTYIVLLSHSDDQKCTYRIDNYDKYASNQIEAVSETGNSFVPGPGFYTWGYICSYEKDMWTDGDFYNSRIPPAAYAGVIVYYDNSYPEISFFGPVLESEDFHKIRYLYPDKPEDGLPLDYLMDILWSEKSGAKHSKKVEIIILWERPIDGQILSASFQISVDPAEDTTPTGN